MTSYQVDSEALFATTASARATMERIQAEAAGLTGLLTNLQSSWGGQASVAFQSVVGEWSSAQTSINDSALSLNQALVFAGQQYAETESANARLFMG